jgi:acyl-CoA thioester hydrolase
MTAPYTRRVHYYETDQMGIVHHSNYIRWFEEARTDYMARNGIGYADIEARGVQIPVTGVSCSYKTAVPFDQLLEIHTRLTFFNGVRMSYQYEVRSQNGSVLHATGQTDHCFIDAVTRAPLNVKKRLPDYSRQAQTLLSENES